MLMGSLISAVDGTSPPCQPFLRTWASDYQETIVAWNPKCIKRNGLFYQFKTGDESWAMPILPDACVNILFELNPSQPRAILCGIRTGEAMLVTKPNCVYFGFKPYTFLGIRSEKFSCAELVSWSIRLEDAFGNGDRLIEELLRAESFQERVERMCRYAEREMVDYEYTPVLAEYLAVTLCTAGGNAELNKLNSIMGYSSRYVREKFKECYGISPKQYNGIMRFQNAIKELARDESRLSTVATDVGYFDQAHFIHSFKEHATISPGEFVRLLRSGSQTK